MVRLGWGHTASRLLNLNILRGEPRFPKPDVAASLTRAVRRATSGLPVETTHKLPTSGLPVETTHELPTSGLPVETTHRVAHFGPSRRPGRPRVGNWLQPAARIRSFTA